MKQNRDLLQCARRPSEVRGAETSQVYLAIRSGFICLYFGWKELIIGPTSVSLTLVSDTDVMGYAFLFAQIAATGFEVRFCCGCLVGCEFCKFGSGGGRQWVAHSCLQFKGEEAARRRSGSTGPAMACRQAWSQVRLAGRAAGSGRLRQAGMIREIFWGQAAAPVFMDRLQAALVPTRA
jgi:hypothetical protein